LTRQRESSSKNQGKGGAIQSSKRSSAGVVQVQAWTQGQGADVRGRGVDVMLGCGRRAWM